VEVAPTRRLTGRIVPTSQRSAAKLRILSFLFLILRPRLLYLLRYVFFFKRLPRFSSPARISEKIALRVLSGFSPPWRQRMADKLEVRGTVHRICPDLRLKKIYAVYERPDELELAALPPSFVLKLNNASSANLVVLNKAEVEESELRRKIASLLRRNYYHASQEPCYRGIRNRVFAEELTLGATGYYPLEFRIFCFHGKARFIDYEVIPNERGDSVIVDIDWNPLPVKYAYAKLEASRIPRPPHLEEAIRISERLAAGLDFVRVDLYDLPDGLVFGEMTNLPWGGLVRLAPEGGDEFLGRYWEPYAARESETEILLQESGNYAQPEDCSLDSIRL